MALPTPIRRSLLIGIDEYLPDPKDSNKRCSNLQGCVNDVRSMREYLTNTVGVPEENIVSLITINTLRDGPATARSPANGEDAHSEDANVNGKRAGPNQSLPTYNNILAKLKELRDDCRPGDLVYIHYSGHGIRRGDEKFKNEIDDEADGDKINGTALVPTDAMVVRKFITGKEIGSIIQEMVKEKNARVCLVLDSCHSGKGIRYSYHGNTDQSDSFGPRYADFNFETDYSWVEESEKRAKDTDSKLGQFLNKGTSGTRAPEATVDWLVDPQGCTIVTACKSMQVAGESAIEGSRNMGILTRGMLDLLSKNTWALRPTYRKICEHVSRVSRKRNQTPSVLGDANIEFFGDNPVLERPTCSVLSTKAADGSVTLDIGLAQGVTKGAIYRICKDGDVSSDDTLPQVEITNVFELRSSGKLKGGSSADPKALSERASPGTRLVVDKWALPEPIGVHFLLEDPDDREIFRIELRKIVNLDLAGEQEGASDIYQICIGKWKEQDIYGIKERGCLLTRVPVIPIQEKNAIRKLAFVIRQVVRYRSILDTISLAKPSDRLQAESIDFRVYHPDDKADEGIEMRDQTELSVKENEALQYVVGYDGTRVATMPPLWLALFAANESWGITRIYPREGSGQTAIEMDHVDDELDEISVRFRIEPQFVGTDPHSVDARFTLFVAAGHVSPSWDEIMLSPLPREGSLIRLQDEMHVNMGDAAPAKDRLRGPELEKGVTGVTKTTRKIDRPAWYIKTFTVHVISPQDTESFAHCP